MIYARAFLDADLVMPAIVVEEEEGEREFS